MPISATNFQNSFGFQHLFDLKYRIKFKNKINKFNNSQLQMLNSLISFCYNALIFMFRNHTSLP